MIDDDENVLDIDAFATIKQDLSNYESDKTSHSRGFYFSTP